MTAAALVAALGFAVGEIWFGHFESGTPRWQKTLKLALTVGIAAALGRWIGAGAGIGFVAVFATVGLGFHFWWCRRNEIDPWTAEPHERYRRLRGWT